MATGANDKTEKPTGKRLSDARTKGDTAKSQDVNSAAALLFGFLLLYYTGASVRRQLSELMEKYMGGLTTEPLTTAMFTEIMISLARCATMILLPIVGGLLIVGVAASLAQVGFLISLQKIKPKFSKLDPIKGFKNTFFSIRSLVKTAMSIAKFAIVATVAFCSIRNDLDKFLEISTSNLEQMLIMASHTIFWLGMKIAIILLFIAILDYAYQKWQYLKDLRMTKQEVKDEQKQTEGDPMVKGRIRTIQRQWAVRRMMSDVPEADVVVTNPVHLAIALKYDGNTMTAPKVVAKGADLIAKRIVKIAKENNVPIFEDKPLAHAIFKAVEIGYEVPQKLYHAVARVLSYIYKLRRTYGKALT
jgi:flagellar biosynthetic protein FlhB